LEHEQQVEDAASRVLEEIDHLGDKFAHLTEEIKSNLAQTQKSLMHQAGRVKHQASEQMETMATPISKVTEEVKEQYVSAKEDAMDWFQSAGHDASEMARQKGEELHYRVQQGADTVKGKTDEIQEQLKQKAQYLYNQSGSMTDDAREALSGKLYEAKQSVQDAHTKAESMATDAKYSAEEGTEYLKGKYYDARDKAEAMATDAKHRAVEGTEYLQSKYYDARDKAGAMAADAKHRAEEEAEHLKGKYYDTRDKAESMATDTKHRVEEEAEHLKGKYYDTRDKTESMTTDAKYSAEEGTEYLKGKYYDVHDKAESMTTDAKRSAEEGAEHLQGQYYDTRDKAESMARNTEQQMKKGAEQMEDTAHGTLQNLMLAIQEQFSRSGHWTQQHVFDPISHVFTSTDNAEDIHDEMLKTTTPPSNSFIHQTRSMTADELAQQLITLIQQSDQIVRATQFNVDTLEEELGTSLRQVVQHLRRSGLDSRQKRNIAEMDRQQLIMYVRAMLSRVEREARDAYTSVQAIRDDTADKIQHYFSGIMQSYQPLSNVDTLVHDRFHELTRRIMQQLNQSETWARRRYEMSRKMRQQAEPALSGDLGEFIDSLRGWLDTAHRVAEQQHEQMMTESRTLGKALINEFGAYSEADDTNAEPPLSQPTTEPSSSSYRQQSRVSGMSHDKNGHNPVGATMKQWMQWFIGANASGDEDRSHLLMSRPITALSRKVPEMCDNESTTSYWPLVRQWQKAREQIESTYQRWVHGTPLYSEKQHHHHHHHRNGYDPRRAMADEPPALRAHMSTSSNRPSQFGYQLLPNRAQQAMDYFPISLSYSACLFILLLGLWGRRRYQQEQMREMSPSAVIHRKVVTPSLTARRVTRSMSSSSSSSSSSNGNNDAIGDIGEGETYATTTTVEVLEQSDKTGHTPTGARYASANALVNTTDAIFHIAYTLPIALLILGALEYAGYGVWLLHLLWASFLTGQCIQTLRNVATHHGRLWADIGETSTIGVVVLASMLSFYTALSGRPLV
jgi:uncharacterized membrane protein YecN with MAPEG domain